MVAVPSPRERSRTTAGVTSASAASSVTATPGKTWRSVASTDSCTSTPTGSSVRTSADWSAARTGAPVAVTRTTGALSLPTMPASGSATWVPAGIAIASPLEDAFSPSAPKIPSSTVALTAPGLAMSSTSVAPTVVLPPTIHDSMLAVRHAEAAKPERSSSLMSAEVATESDSDSLPSGSSTYRAGSASPFTPSAVRVSTAGSASPVVPDVVEMSAATVIALASAASRPTARSGPLHAATVDEASGETSTEAASPPTVGHDAFAPPTTAPMATTDSTAPAAPRPQRSGRRPSGASRLFRARRAGRSCTGDSASTSGSTSVSDSASGPGSMGSS